MKNWRVKVENTKKKGLAHCTNKNIFEKPQNKVYSSAIIVCQFYF